MAESFDMIAKTFFGLERVLADELDLLGAADVKLGRRMVAFTGDLALMYRANIYCRTAVRILKPIASFTATDERELYRGIGLVDWLAHLDADGTLAIDPVVYSPIFTNSLYAAQLTKDAIVDQFRERTGHRPGVDLNDPVLRINLHINADQVTVYLDASGDSLHKRGYRTATGEAPINEVLAAGLLRLSGWDANSPLADFMCGSGTFLIEGALLARRMAPGIVRKQFGYMRWKDFDLSLHESILAEARQTALPNLPFPIQGTDLDATVIAAARDNARRAGVEGDIHFAVENFESAVPPGPAGTLITNPPYDERMKTSQIAAVYTRIGDVLARNWSSYTAWIFTGNLEAAKHIGLRASARIRLFNGPIECRLIRFAVFAAPPRVSEGDDLPPAEPSKTHAERGQDQADALRNRLARMAKHWHRWARRQGITCYRIYDRDIPEIPLTIDWYEGQLVISEHQRPHSRTEIEHRNWLNQTVENISRTLEVPPERVALHARLRDASHSGKKITPPPPAIVHEADLQYEVRLSGAKDTGLALDQRILRAMVRAEATGKRFLNLFSHTGASSVAAAAGGARTTTSVEAMPGLLDWTKRNLQLNRLLSARQALICQDPLVFVQNLDPRNGPQFDLAMVEPPSFDGQRRGGVWNVQDGHPELLNRLLECMSIGGKIYFVTTFRRLTFHAEHISGATVREITRQTVPPDFRNKKVHRCWVVIRTAS